MCSMLEKFEMMNLLFGELCLVVLPITVSVINLLSELCFGPDT